ncbi:coiled-coil domain-containing protein 87 isoform X4 [Hydra vulgaris]|uniref:Coiled-coil domain-containing protein 87 isoform X4 n=1 Tax=Hydra vulgaris TaxID=6087 RepID=A0ABM4DEE2_HYDVU
MFRSSEIKMEVKKLKERNLSCYSSLEKENDLTNSKNRRSSFLNINPNNHTNKEQIGCVEDKCFDIQSMTDYELQKLTGDDLKNLLSNNSKVELNSDEGIPALLMNSTVLKRSDDLNNTLRFTEVERPCSVASTVSTVDASENEDLGFTHPAVLNVKVPRKGVFKMPSSKTCVTPIDNPLTIEKNSICEDIFNEIDIGKIRDLDNHLNIIEEIHEVYNEIRAFLPKDHFHFNENLEGSDPVICEQVSMSKLAEKSKFYSSIVNKELQLEQGVKTSNKVKEVISSNSKCSCNSSASNNKKNIIKICNEKEHQQKKNSEIDINFDDYQKFISKTGNDYLFSIYHLYSKELYMNEEQITYISYLKEKKLQLKNKHHQFQPGHWNPFCIFIDGLEQEKSLNDLLNVEAEHLNDKALISKLQDRLEQIWDSLKMSFQQRVAMTLKYYSVDIKTISDVVEAWEAVAELIVKRETVLLEIFAFEQLASDPRRFFEKGFQGSSEARMNEAKIRAKQTKDIVRLEKKICKLIHYIKQQYHDHVSYKDVNYQLKMKTDRLEMLNWLRIEKNTI